MATENYGEDRDPNRAPVLIKWPVSPPLLCGREVRVLTEHFIF